MPELPELTALTNVLHSPLFQQALVLLTALCAGLLVLTVMARLDVTSTSASGRALAAYRTDTVDTPLEQLGAALIRRLPGLRNLLGLEVHRRWLAPGRPALVSPRLRWACASAAGRWPAACACALSGMPGLARARCIGFLLPFVRQRSAADKGAPAGAEQPARPVGDAGGGDGRRQPARPGHRACGRAGRAAGAHPADRPGRATRDRPAAVRPRQGGRPAGRRRRPLRPARAAGLRGPDRHGRQAPARPGRS